MESPVTLRLDKKMRRQIARIAERRRISKSEVIRQALNSWVELYEDNSAPFEAVADLLGVVRGGNPKRSENGGRKFREILQEKRKQP